MAMKQPLISALLVLSLSGATAWSQTASTSSKPVAPAPAARKLPLCPPGVVDLPWNVFFKTPVGPLGLQLTDRIKELNGKKVRLLGYMVRREAPTPGILFLTPVPTSIEEDEAGFSDLPPQVVRVSVPSAKTQIIPYTGRPLLLTGTLTIGNHEESKETAGGAVFLFHLTLEETTHQNNL